MAADYEEIQACEVVHEDQEGADVALAGERHTSQDIACMVDLDPAHTINSRVSPSLFFYWITIRT